MESPSHHVDDTDVRGTFVNRWFSGLAHELRWLEFSGTCREPTPEMPG